MLKTVDAVTFFGDNCPGGIPSDTEPPDMEQLITRTSTLNPSRYPFISVKKILERENIKLEASETTVESIRSIDENTVYVIAGQQAGLFCGPLYTLYKAMHAVRLSARLSAATGRKVIPLFWIASDDHDFNEVSQIFVRTQDGSRDIVKYSPEKLLENTPVGKIVIDEGIYKAINKLAAHMTSGQFSESYIDLLRNAWQPYRLWSEAFAFQMLKIFSCHGLVMFDPGWKGVKDLFKKIFIAELSDPLASTSLVNKEYFGFQTGKERKKAIRKHERSTNLFLEVNDIRKPLFVTENGFKAGETVFSGEELIDMVNSEPDRFSPAATLRPVCQDMVFPVAALICGPGERFYVNQIKPLYAHFGVDGSIAWPRASFTIIDPRTIRSAKKEGITLPELFEDISRIRTNIARNSFPVEVEKHLDSLEQSIETGFEPLLQSTGSLDPTLINSLRKEKGRVRHILRGIRERILRVHKKSVHISEKRLNSASYFLLPGGKAQERCFGLDLIYPFPGKEGFDELLMLTSPGEERHRIVLP